MCKVTIFSLSTASFRLSIQKTQKIPRKRQTKFYSSLTSILHFSLSLPQIPSTMKLAEALSIRKDLQKRIQQLGQRIQNNVKVQEGDAPSEEPMELMKELDACLAQLEDLIWRINATNMQTKNAEGVTLTQLMARKDVLTMRVSNLRNIFETASAGQDRYSRSEIKTVTVVDVKAIGKQADECSAQLRQLDMEIQALNFQTELV